MLRQVWLVLGWFWVAAVFYLSLTPQPPQPIEFDGVDKLEHALAYGLLMLWFCQVYAESVLRIRLLLALVAMGAGIEFLQGMTGYRFFEYADMVANSAGVLIGWGLAHTRMGRMISLLEQNGKN